MARTITSLEVFKKYAHSSTGKTTNPVDLFLLENLLGRNGLYQPCPRPMVMILNWLEGDRESVDEYHLRNHLMYPSDITYEGLPFGFNRKMIQANYGKKGQSGAPPFEVMEKRDFYDMWITKFPIITESTLEDWLVLFLFGTYALKSGGVSVTYLQDVDLSGFGRIMEKLKSLARLEPAIYEETPFVMEDGLGSTYNRVCIYKRPEWEPPRPSLDLMRTN